MTELVSLAAARRIALAALGFGKPRPDHVAKSHLLKTLERLALHQIDSVNVLVRAHYLPAFSRLGGYDRALLDRIAWGRSRERRLFEYWGHEASLLPFDVHPLLRWRMARADRGETGWGSLRIFARERRSEAEDILARIRDTGPLAASDLSEGKGRGGWWGWGDAKMALEWLFWAGHVTTATRRGSFERVYDLTERVIPDAVTMQPVPDEREAQRALVARAAKALGIATEADLRDYFRLSPGETRIAVETLVEDGQLIPARVEGWRQPAFLHRDARAPRRIDAQALLAPFDPVVWDRGRAERLFGFQYRIEIYVPAAKRRYGYYVLPFLYNDRLVARVDLKADRQAGRLRVPAVYLEADAPAATREALAQELNRLAAWLRLEAGSEPLPG